MENRIYVAEGDDIGIVARALDSGLRRKMLDLLHRRRMNVNQIAEELGIPQSTCTVNVQILERAKLVRTEQVAAVKGAQKICSIRYDEIVLMLRKGESAADSRFISNEMPIGLYTDSRLELPAAW